MLEKNICPEEPDIGASYVALLQYHADRSRYLAETFAALLDTPLHDSARGKDWDEHAAGLRLCMALNYARAAGFARRVAMRTAGTLGRWDAGHGRRDR